MKRSGIGDGGEIIQVEGGGRIIRATGRKDRHSKVYTSKGPRDRRVRLSAPTAIQFYDVQDRLGYDRPSKAVDWLINKAKHAIDNLSSTQPPPPPPQQQQQQDEVVATLMNPATGSSCHPGHELQRKQDCPKNNFSSSLMPLPPPPSPSPSPSPAELPNSMMKSLFPMSSGNSSLLNSLSRTGRIQTGRDLGLSLQTLEDHKNNRPSSSSYSSTDHQDEHELLLPAGATNNPNPIPFHDHDTNNYPKSVPDPWNGGGGEDETTRHAGFIFNSHSIMPSQQQQQQLFYSPFINSAIFSQRETNYPHLIHSASWNDNRQFPSSNNHEDHIQTTQSSLFSVHFDSNFQVPARIHGEDAEPTSNSIPHAPINPNTRNKTF